MDKRYVILLVYRGFSICTLKKAVPSSGDMPGYVIDHPQFKGLHYNHVQSAINAIKGK